MNTNWETYYCEHCANTLAEVTENNLIRVWCRKCLVKVILNFKNNCKHMLGELTEDGAIIKCRKCGKKVEVNWENRFKGLEKRAQYLRYKNIEIDLKTAL